MTHENLITAPLGTTLEEAKVILHRHRIEKLPLVDEHFNLKGLITYKDILKREDFPHAATDDQGRLLVAAAIGVGEQAVQRAAPGGRGRRCAGHRYGAWSLARRAGDDTCRQTALAGAAGVGRQRGDG